MPTIADTSLEYDRNVKIPLGTKNAIQEVWLLNLRDQCVEIYRSPSPGGYETILVLRGQQPLNPLAFPDISWTAAQLLGDESV